MSKDDKAVLLLPEGGGSTQPLNMSTRKIPRSKAGRCVRLTTYHFLVPNVKKIRGLNLPDLPWGGGGLLPGLKPVFSISPGRRIGTVMPELLQLLLMC
jgi:hypothetical protein